MIKALLVIDYINSIAGSGTCAEYLENHPEVLSNTNKLIGIFREHKHPIFFIRLGFDKDYSDLPKHAPVASFLKEKQMFQLGTIETEFIQELNYNEGDLVFNKTYGDPFHGSGLLKALQDLNVEEVIFTGIATDNAIINGANSAMINNLKVTIVSDACGGVTDESHEAALAIMKGRTASETLSTQTLLKKIN